MKILLATLAFINPELLKKCISSWPKDVDKAILWQGDHQEMRSIFEECKNNPSFKIIQKRVYNWGVAGGWNLIIKEAFKLDYDAVVFVGSDIIMLPGFWESFIKDTEEYEFIESSHLFNCFMLTRSCYEKVGLFDENFYPAYIEDDDYRIRIRFSGIKYLSNHGHHNLFLHEESSTVNKSNHYRQQCNRTHQFNKLYMMRKWGGQEKERWKPRFNNPFNNPHNDVNSWSLAIRERVLKLWDFLPVDPNDDRLKALRKAMRMKHPFGDSYFKSFDASDGKDNNGI